MDNINVNQLIGSHDIVFITLDTLRYDSAINALNQGQTPNLAAILPEGKWEKRHTPGNFTYPAHQAFFAGFLPTPTAPGLHPRLFAAWFPGSETTDSNSYVFKQDNIVSALTDEGYHTICIGGVGFFNKRSALGSVIPNMFAESHWEEKFGVTCKQSTEHQINCAVQRINAQEKDQRLFLFINICACHQPNHFYIPEQEEDNQLSQQAALAYCDSQLPPLFDCLQQRGPTLLVICSDHGTSYGEDGYTGHRLSHEVVWNVPYMQTILAPKGGRDA